MYVVYEKNTFKVRDLVKNKENEVIVYFNYLNSLINELKLKYNLSHFEIENIKIIIGSLLLDIGQKINIDILSNSKIKKILKIQKFYSNSFICSKSYVLRSKRLLNDIMNR